ncbi:hypothetical protein D046_6665A, partial [Vibrio parahaemolyticus V-223/04]
MIPQAV